MNVSLGFPRSIKDDLNCTLEEHFRTYRAMQREIELVYSCGFLLDLVEGQFETHRTIQYTCTTLVWFRLVVTLIQINKR